MAALSQSRRITSKDIRIEVTPTGVQGSANVMRLYFTAKTSAAITGTFRLWVNGKITAAITYSATVGTLATAVAAALNHANVLGAAAVTAADSVADPGNVEVTNAVSGKYMLYKGVTTDNDGDDTLNATLEVVYATKATETFIVDAEASSFSIGTSATLVEMTAISEDNENHRGVKQGGTIEVMYFEANQDWAHVFYPTAELIFTVYETGKVAGGKFFAVGVVVDKVDKDFPDHEKVEISVSGTQSGAFIIPLDTIYRP